MDLSSAWVKCSAETGNVVLFHLVTKNGSVLFTEPAMGLEMLLTVLLCVLLNSPLRTNKVFLN